MDKKHSTRTELSAISFWFQIQRAISGSASGRGICSVRFLCVCYMVMSVWCRNIAGFPLEVCQDLPGRIAEKIAHGTLTEKKVCSQSSRDDNLWIRPTQKTHFSLLAKQRFLRYWDVIISAVSMLFYLLHLLQFKKKKKYQTLSEAPIKQKCRSAG